MTLFLLTISLTIYENNFAVVKEERKEKAQNVIEIKDLPSAIIARSLEIIPKNFKIKEIRVNYDVISEDVILKRNKGKKIMITTKDGKVIEGTLIAFSPSAILLETEQNFITVNRQNIIKIEAPKFEIEKEIKYEILAEGKEKEFLYQLKYMTEDIDWDAVYTGTIESKLKLNGWFILKNNTEKDFENADITLLSGKVYRKYARPKPIIKTAKAMTAPQEIPEKEFFEYFIYHLGKYDFKKFEAKKIPFLEEKIKYVKELWVEQGQKGNPAIVLKFKAPVYLPKGIVTFYKEEKNRIEMIGEADIPYTPEGKELELKIGKAHSISFERKVLETQKITRNVEEKEKEITIKNYKDKDVEVYIFENIPGDWEMLKVSHNYEKISAHRIKFVIKIKGKSEEKIRYRVRIKY